MRPRRGGGGDRPTATRRGGVVALAAGALLVVASVPRFGAPTYTLEPGYTDHMRHEYSAWGFLHMGFDVFRVPLEDWSVHAQHVHTLWPQLPVIYPPGLPVAFLPFGVASNEGLLPDGRVHMLMVMLLGASAVAASFQLFRTLRLTHETGLAIVLGALGTILFLTWGLDGFVDPLAAGLALLGIYWAERGAAGRGLVALSVALSLQFRLWYLWPVAIALVVRRRRELRGWQLGVSAVLAAAAATAFALAVPSLAKLHEIRVEPNPLALTGGVGTEQAIALGLGGALLGIVWSLEGVAPAASVALVLALIFGVDQWEAWYPILLLPLLVVVRNRSAQAAVTVAFLQLVLYLGGFPNVLRSVHLYVDAVR